MIDSDEELIAEMKRADTVDSGVGTLYGDDYRWSMPPTILEEPNTSSTFNNFNHLQQQEVALTEEQLQER
jgi:hypothetical protein